MSEELTLNATTLRYILAINNAIQDRGAELSLNSVKVICVALDGTYHFDDAPVSEIKLTGAQIDELMMQVAQHETERQEKGIMIANEYAPGTSVHPERRMWNGEDIVREIPEKKL